MVVSASSALREIVRPGSGAAVADAPDAFASAVTGLLANPNRRGVPRRARAEEFTWSASVRAMLSVLGHAPPGEAFRRVARPARSAPDPAV